MNKKKGITTKDHKSFWIKAIEIVIIALVILVPIAFYPHCIPIFIPAKELIAEVLILISLMFWGFKIINREEIRFISTPINFSILSFMTICVLSLLWSNSLFVSFKELPLFLAGPCLYFVIINNIQDDKQINHILNVLLVIGSLFGVYGILQYQGIDFSFWAFNVGRQQVFGLFGNVNYFAEYLIVPLPVAVSLFFVSRNRLKKTLLLIGILAMGTSLIVTFTRGSYLGFGSSLIFMFFLFLIFRGKSFIRENKKIFTIVLVAIIVITFLFVVPTPLNKSGTIISKIKSRISITTLTQSFSISSRITNWKCTTLMIKDHLLLGSGIGTFKYNSLSYQAKFFEQGENRALYPYVFADKTHNEYLQMWAEIGIIGLGIFIWLLINYFSYGLKLLKRIKDNYKQGMIIGLMGSMIAVLVDALFGFPFHLPATVILFWLALGLTMVISVGNEVDLKEINPAQMNSKQKKSRKKDSNIFRFKLLFYIGIILLTIFLGMILIRPFMARIYWYYGDRELKRGNLNKTIGIFEDALKWDPYLGQVYYDMGKILQGKKFYGLAQECFEKAEKYVDYPDLPQYLAFIYLKKGLPDKAVVKTKQAISYQQNEKFMVPLHSQLGDIYLYQKKYKLAEIAFKNALEIDSDFVNAHYGLAGIYLKQGKQIEALIEFQKVIELAPDSEKAKYSKIMIQKINKN